MDGQLIERMVQGLSEEELELFISVTEKLAANLRTKAGTDITDIDTPCRCMNAEVT